MASLTVKLHATRNFQDLNSAPHGSGRQTKQSKNSSWKSNEGKFSSDPTPWARGRTKNWDIPIDFKCLPHTLLPSASEESQITWEPRCSSGRQIIPAGNQQKPCRQYKRDWNIYSWDVWKAESFQTSLEIPLYQTSQIHLTSTNFHHPR